MTGPRDYLDYIADKLEAADKVAEFVRGMTLLTIAERVSTARLTVSGLPYTVCISAQRRPRGRALVSLGKAFASPSVCRVRS